jgi:hypothetical protein
MAGDRVPVVLVPRFTTYVGQTDFWTLPIDVQAYSSVELMAWRGPLLGTAPTFTIFGMESIDRQHWSEVAGSTGDDPGTNTEAAYDWQFSGRWFRLRVTLGGTAPGVSWWAQGFLEKRER